MSIDKNCQKHFDQLCKEFENFKTHVSKKERDRLIKEIESLQNELRNCKL